MEHMEQGRTYEISGNFSEAISSYLQAALIFEKEGLTEDPKANTGEALYRAAACFVELQDYPKAITCYKNAINAYSHSQLEVKDKFQKISSCCADLATCLLSPTIGKPDYPNAIRFFRKAMEFTIKRAEIEDDVLQKYVYERAAIYNAFVALINLLQEFPEQARELLDKSVDLVNRYKVSGFGITLINFMIYILNSEYEEARKNLQIIEAEASNLSQSGPSFQAILIGVLHNALIGKVPEERIYLTKVETEEKGMVYIGIDTLRNIYLHTLYHANFDTDRSSWKETYGILYGTIKDENLIVADAIPITSGEKFEVAFEETHYSKAAEFDAIAAEQGLFAVGWYHSHPGLGLFLSPTDILNQLGYQNLNPKAVALVFDFTKVSEKYLGFEIFRLDAPELGTSSDFHQVKWKITDMKKSFQKEVPTIVENFKASVMKIIKKSPKITIEQIAQHVNYSIFVVKEILMEMYKNKDDFKGILFDMEANTLLNEDSSHRAILNLVKSYNTVSFSLISKVLNVTENFAAKLLEDMSNKGLIQGKIRLGSSDFSKS